MSKVHLMAEPPCWFDTDNIFDGVETTLDTTERLLWDPRRYTLLPCHSLQVGKLWRLTVGGRVGAPDPSPAIGDMQIVLIQGFDGFDNNGGSIANCLIPAADIYDPAVGGSFQAEFMIAVRATGLGTRTAAPYVTSFGTWITATNRIVQTNRLPHPNFDNTVPSALAMTASLASGSAQIFIGTVALEALN